MSVGGKCLGGKCQWAENIWAANVFGRQMSLCGKHLGGKCLWAANVSGWQMSERPMSLGGKCQVDNVSARQMSNVCFMAHVKTTNVQNDRHLVTSIWVANILAAKLKNPYSGHTSASHHIINFRGIINLLLQLGLRSSQKAAWTKKGRI